MGTSGLSTDIEVASGERISREEFCERLTATQNRIAQLVPANVSLADALIAERRGDAALAEAEWSR